MKKIATLVALLAVSGAAFADGQTQSSNSSSGSNAASVNAGNAQSISFSTPANTTAVVTEGVTANTTATVNSTSTVNGVTTQHETIGGTTTENIKNVPNVTVSNLTTSNDTCMGSVTAGGSAVGFGLSFGTTHIDQNCVMLKNSRELWNMGFRAAAMARMCMDKANKEALELTGFTCPQDQKASK